MDTEKQLRDALKPCPFCRQAKVYEEQYFDSYNTSDTPDEHAIECPQCGARGGKYATSEKARDVWNTRALPPTSEKPGELREALGWMLRESVWTRRGYGSHALSCVICNRVVSDGETHSEDCIVAKANVAYKEASDAVKALQGELRAAQEALRQIADMPNDNGYIEAPAASWGAAVELAREGLGWEHENFAQPTGAESEPAGLEQTLTGEHTWREWNALLDYGIVDPDGFREAGINESTKFTRDEFERRAIRCTIMRKAMPAQLAQEKGGAE